MTANDEEQWARVAGTNERYEASTFGRVRAMFQPLTGRPRGNANDLDGEVIRSYPGTRDYLFVQLDTGTSSRTWSVAECVLSAFVGPRPTPDHLACYMDADCSNVHLSNLAWLTPKERKDLASKNGHSRRRATRVNGMVTEYQCSKCMDWFEERRFYKLKGGVSRLGNPLTRCGLHSECRTCMNVRRQRYRQQHGDGGAPSALEKIAPLVEQLSGERVTLDQLDAKEVGRRISSARIRFACSQKDMPKLAGLLVDPATRAAGYRFVVLDTV